jgi:hypothetical protein
MDPVELYARTVATSTDGFVYVGIGTSKANIAAYEISTGQHREILPESAQTVDMASVYRGEDGHVYVSVGTRSFQLERWTATELPAGQSPARLSNDCLADGRTLELHDRTLKITDPKTKATTERHFQYDGNVLPLFRVGFGPDGALYGSTILPIHLMKLDPAGRRLLEIGDIGGGEVYSFLNHSNRLLMAAYAGTASLMAFDPATPFRLGEAASNPALVHFSGDDHGWRPEAMISGLGGDVYLGAVAGYGKVDGPLTVWHVKQGTVEQHRMIENQSVISLAMWNDRLIGGTTIHGGGGSHPIAKEARIFIWNPATRQIEFDMVAVPGTTHITDLITAPNDRVYGIAGPYLFVFDPKTRQVTRPKRLPFRHPVSNSVALGPDGRIWGLASDGIFVIDPKTDEASLVAKSPAPITAGFGMKDGAIYFVCDADVYRWRM